MDYLKHYTLLVEKAKREMRNKGGEVYYEKHHIIPKSVGGTNEDSNLVLLTGKEHFIAHLLLPQIYPHEPKLKMAFWFMCNQQGRGRQSERHTPTARQYADAKLAFIEAQRELKKGSKNPEQSKRMKKNNPNYKPGVKEKQSLAKLGDKNSSKQPEVREKLRKALIGREILWGSKISKTRIAKGLGKGPKSETHKKRISEALKGRSKPEYTCPHCGKVGKGASNMQRWHFDNCKNKNNG